MNNNEIAQLIQEAKQRKEEFDNASIRCGMIGLSGSGKSSLINAIAGQKIAPVGSTEQTMEAQSFTHADIEFVDLPGCGTEKWPQNTYIESLQLGSYDCFIIVTSNRLYESDIYLYNEMQVERGMPCFIVRNKIDLAIQDEQHDNNLSEDETVEKVRSNILSSISLDGSTIYLTSARQPTRWDLPRLLRDIADSQSGVKHDKFIAGMGVWSQEAIEKKRAVAEKVVSWSSVLSASNGFNPVPGFDVTVDVGLLVAMVSQLNSIYGLSEDQLQFIEKSVPGIMETPKYRAIKQGVLKLIARYAVADGVLLVLKRMGATLAIKNIGKYLPFVGSLIAAGIGFKMTAAFGEAYIVEAEDQAASLLDQVVASSM